MNISTDASSYLSMLTGPGLSEKRNSGADLDNAMPPPPPPEFNSNLDISSLGQWLSGLSDDERSELNDYLQTIRDAVNSEEVDIDALASDAPASLQALAEQQGVELTSLVSALVDRVAAPQFTAGMPPPPPGSPEDRQEVVAFHEQVLDADEDGSFDAETLASSAPEAVIAMAEERGMALTELVSWMSEHQPPPQHSTQQISLAQGEEISTLFSASAGDEATELANVIARFLKG